MLFIMLIFSVVSYVECVIGYMIFIPAYTFTSTFVACRIPTQVTGYTSLCHAYTYCFSVLCRWRVKQEKPGDKGALEAFVGGLDEANSERSPS
jgi:hypothetical protein